MAGVLRTINSIWTWTCWILLVLVGTPLMAIVFAVTVPFDRGRYVVGRFFRLIGVTMAKVNPFWRFRWSGTPPADMRRPYVVVSNHESFTDILLISHLPWEMKWMSKVEIFRIPCVGWMMQMAGDIPIQRGSGARAAITALRACRAVLDRKVSVMMFPEGTRSPDGEMLPFKDGAFRLAVDAQVPILPLAVSGTRTALPKHDWRFNPSRAEVRILEPIETAGLTHKDIPALSERIRAVIAAAREELRGELG